MNAPLPTTLDLRRAFLGVFAAVVDYGYSTVSQANDTQDDDDDSELDAEDVRCDLANAIGEACDMLGIDYDAHAADLNDMVCEAWQGLNEYLIRTTDR